MLSHILYEQTCITKRNIVIILILLKVNNDEKIITNFSYELQIMINMSIVYYDKYYYKSSLISVRKKCDYDYYLLILY